MSRTLDLETWSDAGIPLLRNPREFVGALHARHLPAPGTAIVAVLDPLHRVVGSASFAPRADSSDGWQYRNAILAHLRRVVPHDLRRAVPSRTAVLLLCRAGEPGWTPQDGAWMWGLRDAAGLHGLRCGSYITLTPQGWQVLGDGRHGRNPHAGSWTDGSPPANVATLPDRSSDSRHWARRSAPPLRRAAGR
ncbi:hypothetical protein ACIQGZ_23630 [Streptomyces sp. NPDC092296]|uniref:hypothetical protein n=1 Tax=Streptomyces sp. NPDC092296 TaxID=3366012 RepID=UPI003826AC89